MGNGGDHFAIYAPPLLLHVSILISKNSRLPPREQNKSKMLPVSLSRTIDTALRAYLDI